jgi:hypothetical protein
VAVKYRHKRYQQENGIEHSDMGTIGTEPTSREKRMMLLEEKADRGSIYLALFVAGWISALAANHVSELWSEHGQLDVVQHKVVPALKAKVGCEKKLAAITKGVAKQAIKGANIDSEPIPDEKDIPEDNCSPTK